MHYIHSEFSYHTIFYANKFIEQDGSFSEMLIDKFLYLAGYNTTSIQFKLSCLDIPAQG